MGCSSFFIDYYFLIVKGLACSFGKFLKEFFPHVVIMVALICTTVIGRELFVGGILGSLIVKGMILGTVYLGAAALTGQLRSLISLVKRKKHEEVEMLPMRPILFVCQFCSGSMYIGISAHLKRKQDQR